MRLEPLKEDILYTGNKPLEFILVPKCPLFRDSTVPVCSLCVGTVPSVLKTKTRERSTANGGTRFYLTSLSYLNMQTFFFIFSPIIYTDSYSVKKCTDNETKVHNYIISTELPKICLI